MNEIFTLGRWVNQSHALGAKKEEDNKHLMYRAVFFANQKDRDAFLELSVEAYPFETFALDTLNGNYIIQHKFIRQ